MIFRGVQKLLRTGGTLGNLPGSVRAGRTV
jgi:hypothetical protein